MNYVLVLLVALSLLLQLFGYYALIFRIEPFMYQFYLISWWSFILLVDAILAWKTKRFLLLNRRLPSLVLASAAFWCVFELINIRLQNWFYINVPEQPALRFTGYLLAFGTVIPAVYLIKTLVARLIPDIRTKPIFLGKWVAYAPLLGLLCLSLSLAFPVQFFAFAWIFLAFIIDTYNYRKGYPSFLSDLEKGSLREIVATGVSGMVCGFFWEFWNFWAVTKWVYTVPFFERTKLFEMPVPGFLGFAFFALETIAFVNLLHHSRFLTIFRGWVSLAALVFSLASFALIDRYTVFSYIPRVEQLPFLSDATRHTLKNAHVKTAYAIDPGMLRSDERTSLALMQLKGLGLPHWMALHRYGINNLHDLSTLDQSRLSSIIDEHNMRRVRIYLRAAREQKDPDPPSK